MVAEGGRDRVRSSSRIDDRPGGVCDPAGGEQRNCGEPRRACQLRHRGKADPTERDAEYGRQPPGGPGPADIHEGRRGRSGPCDAEHHSLQGPVEAEKADRCERSGDEEVDPSVVDAPHPCPGTRTPCYAVVERARPEHQGCGRGENRGRDEAPPIGGGDEDGSDPAGEEEARSVQNAAKPGANEQGVSRGHVTAHVAARPRARLGRES